MIKHTHTDPVDINFTKLEERINQINKPKQFTHWQFKRKLLDGYFLNPNGSKRVKPILIMATGGSKVVAYYLQMLLESHNMIVEVIEPRDFFYKQNISVFKNLIVISTSGKTNGIKEAFNSFDGKKYLISLNSNNKFNNTVQISYNNDYYQKIGNEKSFVSLASTLGQMALILSLSYLDNEISNDYHKIELINQKISVLMKKSSNLIKSIDFDFKNTNTVEIISGYDTKVSSSILESNLAETGSATPIIHDKGSYCHGRSNLIFQNQNNPLIYLNHNNTLFDKAILEILKKEYPNIFVFDTLDENENLFWKEYYLTLQMIYLSKKISSDKQIDLTQPEYNPKVIKKLYNFKGGM